MMARTSDIYKNTPGTSKTAEDGKKSFGILCQKEKKNCFRFRFWKQLLNKIFVVKWFSLATNPLVKYFHEKV